MPHKLNIVLLTRSIQNYIKMYVTQNLSSIKKELNIVLQL